jgi:hypothetical protein
LQLTLRWLGFGEGSCETAPRRAPLAGERMTLVRQCPSGQSARSVSLKRLTASFPRPAARAARLIAFADRLCQAGFTRYMRRDGASLGGK